MNNIFHTMESMTLHLISSMAILADAWVRGISQHGLHRSIKTNHQRYTKREIDIKRIRKLQYGRDTSTIALPHSPESPLPSKIP